MFLVSYKTSTYVFEFPFMKQLFFIFYFIVTINAFAQEPYKTYNYSELFKMIENEKDSVFKLKNAHIKFDSISDMRHSYTGIPDPNINLHSNDTIIIDKELQFENVVFLKRLKNPEKYKGVLHHIYFKEKVFLKNCIVTLSNNIFSKKVKVDYNDELYDVYDNVFGKRAYLPFDFFENEFRNGLRIYSNVEVESYLKIQLFIYKNIIWSNDNSGFPRTGFTLKNIANFIFEDNTIKGKGNFRIVSNKMRYAKIVKNDFGNHHLRINVAQQSPFQNLDISKNTFNKTVFFDISHLSQENIVDWQQFKNGIADITAYDEYYYDEIYPQLENKNYFNDALKNKTLDYYFNTFIYENINAYRLHKRFLGKMYNHYKSQYDTENANAVYVDLKNVETNRLKFLYAENPSFKTFFKWKINQFLKVFSDYGTEPSKAIIVSMYVILFFAFIYLLFPNSWDSLGKRRLIHRFDFFQKYLQQNEGMDTLYLKNKAQEISTYEDFKNNLENAKLELPAFFIVWAKPLYKASMFSSIIISRFLKMTDIMKGSWKDLSPSQKRWKSFQLGSILTIGLLYDIFIKILNALMLSINTFTTLGFGEIPIKGLPRYLAIIQGFIGWFMLTLFSVSLISQLLN